MLEKNGEHLILAFPSPSFYGKAFRENYENITFYFALMFLCVCCERFENLIYYSHYFTMTEVRKGKTAFCCLGRQGGGGVVTSLLL